MFPPHRVRRGAVRANLNHMPNDPSPSSLVLLNIGCGSTISPRWINIDKSLNAWISNYPRLKGCLKALRLVPASVRKIDFPKGIRYHDVHKRGLPGADNSVDWIYNSHLIPCMTVEQARALFAESYRVLKPGGRMRVVTADLHRMAVDWQRYTQAYLNGDRKSLMEEGESEVDPDTPLGDLLNRRLGLHWFSRAGMPRWRRFFDYPIQYAYDFHSLKHLLESVGFTDVVRRDMYESDMPDVRVIETRTDSVYVEAGK